MDHQRCGNCRFFFLKKSETDDSSKVAMGSCRRHAPPASARDVMSNARGGSLIAVWPTVGTGLWCGEWQDVRRPGLASL